MAKVLEEGTDANTKEMQALKRSQRIRKAANILPESSVRTRKAYFCHETNGFFQRKVAVANPMNAMTNPDSMNQMLKQNLQGVLHMVMFWTIGSIFQGFITAQMPFPLGHKFKNMLQ